MSTPTFMQQWAERYTPRRPNPWVERKAVVGMVLGLTVWAFYVGVGRVCVPAIQRRPGSAFSREAGIGILVPFIVLWVMFVWSYVMIIATPPGFARDVVPVGNRDMSKEMPSASSMRMTPPLDAEENALASGDNTQHFATPISKEREEPGHSFQRISGTAVPGVAPSLPSPNSKGARIPRPTPYVHSGPRWCDFCQLEKPDRTHHCRQCGTCILQFDHHCVWVGQCVGWRNHAIFVVFNLWAGLFCLFNTGILIASLTLSSKVDVQKAVLAGLSGFLGLFTLFAMLPTHLTLIFTGKSTIDTFQSRTQAMTEQRVLQQAFGSKFWVNKEMRRTAKLWEDEYGGVAPTDRWKVGRPLDRWRQEMGSNWLGWILPIGKAQGNGVDFAANPRFGPNGEWLPMRDWPKAVAVSQRRLANAV